MENKMTRNTIYLSVALVVLLAAVHHVYAFNFQNMSSQSSLRCSGGIVAIGDSDRAVMQKCGDPLDMQSVQDFGPVWIYQLGQSKFMYYLGFKFGKLQRIASAPCSSNHYECHDLR